MIRIIFKITVTFVLLVVVWISFVVFWGTTHNGGSDVSLLVIIGSLIFGISCLWGILRIWRDKQPVTHQPMSTDNSNEFDENAFDLWLAKNSIQTAGISERELVQIRQQFINETN